MGGLLRRWGLICLVTLLAAACVKDIPKIAESTEHAPPVKPAFLLQPGDTLDVMFRYWPELNDTQVVRPDGKISLQLIPEVQAAGLTPDELSQSLHKLYENRIKGPDITVIVRGFAEQKVYVGGEVKSPGMIELKGRMTALEAVMAAGGHLKESAELSNVVILRHKDGKRYAATVNLNDQIEKKQSDLVLLEPRDIVFVPRTLIDQLNQYVDQYINKMIPNTALQYSWGTSGGVISKQFGYGSNL